MPASPEPAASGGTLVRALGRWDAALITVGSILGSAIFMTTGDVARLLPSPAFVLALWAVGGLLTLAGALTYAELGAMYPRAGGQYHYLKEAYGPLWGFIFGWASFAVIQTGGIATLAVAFGEYLGAFVPAASSAWGEKVAGALAIATLSAVNYAGLKHGARVQNVVTVAKVGALVALGGLGLVVPLNADAGAFASAGSASPTLSAFPSAIGVAMIAVLWSYDGWYCLTFSAGEVRRPSRDLPWGLAIGTALVTLLYLLVNLAYFRALPVASVAASSRIGEDAARALFGATGARLVSAAVLVSTFGCISTSILTASRIYLPMAQDGLFFAPLARIHPRFHTPAASIAAQAAWSIALVFSGSYQQLYTYVVVVAFLLHAATGAAVIVLRRRRPDAERPYRTWGYPWVPGVFIVTSLGFVASGVVEKPVEAALGLGLTALGLPCYAYFTARRGGGAAVIHAPDSVDRSNR
jgi:APA family basic amino acid/polyamine antiporter